MTNIPKPIDRSFYKLLTLITFIPSDKKLNKCIYSCILLITHVSCNFTAHFKGKYGTITALHLFDIKQQVTSYFADEDF